MNTQAMTGTALADDMRPPQADQLERINRFAGTAYQADQVHVGELYLTNREVDLCRVPIKPEIFQALAAQLPGHEICLRNTEPNSGPARGYVYAAEVREMTPEELLQVSDGESGSTGMTRVLQVRYYFPWNTVNAGPIRSLLTGDYWEPPVQLHDVIREAANRAWRRVGYHWHVPGSGLDFSGVWLVVSE